MLLAQGSVHGSCHNVVNTLPCTWHNVVKPMRSPLALHYVMRTTIYLQNFQLSLQPLSAGWHRFTGEGCSDSWNFGGKYSYLMRSNVKKGYQILPIQMNFHDNTAGVHVSDINKTPQNKTITMRWGAKIFPLHSLVCLLGSSSTCYMQPQNVMKIFFSTLTNLKITLFCIFVTVYDCACVCLSDCVVYVNVFKM